MPVIADSFADRRLQLLLYTIAAATSVPHLHTKTALKPFQLDYYNPCGNRTRALNRRKCHKWAALRWNGSSHYRRHVAANSRFPTFPPEFPLGSVVSVSLFISLCTSCSRDNIALKLWIFPVHSSCLKQPPFTLKRWTTLKGEPCWPLAVAGTLSSLTS
jgi:hypothetical protein